MLSKTLTMVVALVLFAALAARAELAPPTPELLAAESPMDLDPLLPKPVMERVFHPRLLELWLEALARPEVDLRRRAADAVARAHKQGAPDVQGAVERLMAPLQAADEHPVSRQAAVRALIALDARQAAPALLELSRGGHVEAVLLSDPALADWRHEPAAELWIERVREPEAGLAVRLSAIGALGRAGISRAADALRAVALDRKDSEPVRLAAGAALGQVSDAGLEPAAQSLLAGDNAGRTDRLIAATMLRAHRSQQAIEILLRLARDEEPAVAAAAMHGLLVSAPQQAALPAAAHIRHRDITLRSLGAKAIVSLRSPEAVQTLATLLNDPVRQVRVEARDHLLDLAQEPALEPVVRQTTMGVLGMPASEWRALEQAALMAGKLLMSEAKSALWGLVNNPRHEPRYQAIVALRRLDSREHLPQLLAHAQHLVSAQRQAARDPEAVADPNFNFADPREQWGIGNEVGQIIQMIGLARYAEADALLRSCVPKHSTWLPARRAAIWALGRLLEGQTDAGLSRALVGRINDLNPMDPEDDGVRAMAAIALARMNATNTVGTLRQRMIDDGENTSLGMAFRWAIERLTGQSLPLPEPTRLMMTGWFLEPVELSN